MRIRIPLLVISSSFLQLSCRSFSTSPFLFLSPLFTIMGVISAGSVRRSSAQLRLKRPQVETTDPTASVVPPSSSAPSFSTAGVTLDAIMEQLQRMHAEFGGCLDYLIDEMWQMNTRIGRIAHWQARIGGYGPSPSPSPKHPIVSPSEDDEDGVGSSGNDEMTTSQWLALCHLWQKREVVLVWE